jgi:hypothetical protein
MAEDSRSTSCMASPPKALLYLDRAATFDPKDSKHRQQLLEWCQMQWIATFKKSKQYNNTVFYHDCCSCFSRRRFVHEAGHPPLQTSSVLKMPSFKEVDTAESFYRWLLKMLTNNKNRGLHCYFPSLNRYHMEEEASEMADTDEEDVLIKKRVETAVDQQARQFRQKIEQLEKANRQLLSSSKSWHNKYQELLEQVDREVPIEFQTPLKKKTKESFDVFEVDY